MLAEGAACANGDGNQAAQRDGDALADDDPGPDGDGCADGYGNLEPNSNASFADLDESANGNSHIKSYSHQEHDLVELPIGVVGAPPAGGLVALRPPSQGAAGAIKSRAWRAPRPVCEKGRGLHLLAGHRFPAAAHP